jgi:hypothetical protein
MDRLSIIGAGLSGLIAATQFPQATVYEANGPESIAHKAVLRFRSESLSRLVGIPFRKVRVRKSVFSRGSHRPLDIAMANAYSRKTNGRYIDRSIWNLEPVDRYIAPEDFQQQLAALAGDRIHWNAPVGPSIFEPEPGDGPVISTIPMPILAKMLGAEFPASSPFEFKSISVDRFRVPGADLYQTVYYPDDNITAYRASITGDLLMIENIDTDQYTKPCLSDVLDSFGLRPADVQLIEIGHKQRFGKIAPVNDEMRRNFIYRTTIDHNVYSLGRFATWRNIILDDVIDDIAIIKRLMTTGHYGASLHHSNSKEVGA